MELPMKLPMSHKVRAMFWFQSLGFEEKMMCMKLIALKVKVVILVTQAIVKIVTPVIVLIVTVHLIVILRSQEVNKKSH